MRSVAQCVPRSLHQNSISVSLDGCCEEPTDDLGEMIGDNLCGKSRGVHYLEPECVGLPAKIGCPGGHLARDECRLAPVLLKTTFTFAPLAVEEDGVYAPIDGVGGDDDIGWACLSVQDSNVDRRIELIKLEEPPLCCPRLPLLATAMLALHHFKRRHADGIEVKAAHAGKVSCIKGADCRSLPHARGASNNENIHSHSVPADQGRSPPNARAHLRANI